MTEHCVVNGLPIANGWEKLLAKLKDESQGSPHRAAEISSILESIFKATIPVGERAIQFYKIASDKAGYLAEVLKLIGAEDSAFSKSYPLPLEADELSDVPSGLYLCDIKLSPQDGVTSLVFCGKRTIEEREQRTRFQIGDEAINRFGWEQYDEFVLVKRKCIQSYEIVQINIVDGTIEIRVENHPGVNASTALEQLQVKLNYFLTHHLGLEHQLITPINLFPLIGSIYDDSTEGTVVELGFITATGSSKHETTRSSEIDLRVEKYHAGGKTAIDGLLTPFRLAVRWPSDNRRLHEEILFPGNIRQLSAPNPSLDHALLSGNFTETTMQERVNRLMSRLIHEH
jgi:hypothetical protein